jgi:small subunit ribosomal protein S9
MANIEQYQAVGRRKTATARVTLRPGNGNIIVNKLDANKYFHRDTLMMLVRQPLELTETVGAFDILCNVRGGGKSGQAGAVRLGIARALLQYKVELRGELKQRGLLTRDSRAKERKKYGQRSARARFQFSKR